MPCPGRGDSHSGWLSFLVAGHDYTELPARGEHEPYYVAFEVRDIRDVTIAKEGSFLEDTEAIVATDEWEITIYLSVEEGGDKTFIEALRKAAGLDHADSQASQPYRSR